MKYEEAKEILKEANISEEGSLPYTAGVIFFVGIDYNWDARKIFSETPYSHKVINTVLDNWKQNGILEDGKIYMEHAGGDDKLAEMVEFTLICLCGAGEIVRHEVETEISKPKNMSKKTLNDHLFEQLERISECEGSEQIAVEIDRTNAMIAMSEQILSVARLKMEIIQSNSLEQFAEIDVVHSEVKKIENGDGDQTEVPGVDKKKHQS